MRALAGHSNSLPMPRGVIGGGGPEFRRTSVNSQQTQHVNISGSSQGGVILPNTGNNTIPPPGYTSHNLSTSSPFHPISKPQDINGNIITHQQELKITHEHVVTTPPIQQTEQPKASPGMFLGGKGGDRNVKKLPVIGGAGRAWSNGLFGFTDLCGTCA
jgi:hypothetical protein